MATTAKKKNLKIIMFPFMAQGHIIPFVALALRIEKLSIKSNHHIKIYLVNTPLNIPKIKSNLPLKSSIKLLELPFNSSDHNLPPKIENFDSIPYSLVIHLLEASTSLQEPFQNLLKKFLNKDQENNKIVVIGDFFLSWIGKICKEFNVFSTIFSPSSAFGLGCYRSIWLNLPHKDQDQEQEDEKFMLNDFPEAGEIHKTQLNSFMLEANGSDKWSIFMKRNLSQWSDFNGMLFNTVSEIDQTGLSYFRRVLTNGLVLPVGPILISRTSDHKTEEERFIKTWLDSKLDKSVIYICFGSMNSISETHMSELSMALEISSKNFIWVIKPVSDKTHFLLQEFEERVQESRQGIILKKWVEQVEILSHKAIGLFISHCGWNSILESISFGVPLLGWPMAAEQFFNSMLLEKEVGVLIEVARGKSCEVKCEEIVKKIEVVMEEESEIRKRVEEVKEVMKKALMEDDDEVKGSSLIGLEEFLAQVLV